MSHDPSSAATVAPLRRTTVTWPSWRSWLGALLLGLAFYVAGRACIAMPRDAGRLAPVWIGNAIALTALLRSETRRWSLLVAACAIANFAVSWVNQGRLDACVAISLANMIEYLAGAVVLRKLLGDHVRIDRGRDIALLALVGAGASVVAGVTASVLLWTIRGDVLGLNLRTWLMGHPLGLLLFTPSLLILSRTREHLAETPPGRRALLALFAVAACGAMVFSQVHAPILFMIPPVLLFVSLELGVWGAAVGVLIVALVAVPATLMGLGPIALTRGGFLERDAVLQLFLVTSLFASVPVASLQRRERRLTVAAVDEAARAARAEARAAASEARYRLLADNASDVISTSNMRGEFEYLSPSVEAVSGHAADVLRGATIGPHVHPDDLAAMQRAFVDLARGTRAPGAPIAYRLRRRDGAWVWLESNPKLVRDASGAPVRFVDIARDVTVRKAMEAELEEARRAAEAAVAAKSQFLANMSHELRTPLTAVLGFSGLVAEQPELSAASRRYLDRVRTAGKTLLSTVNDVLDFSRLEIGQVEIALAPAAPGLLAQETLDLFETDATARGLRLRLRDETKGGAFAIDESRVRQILVNLVGNAVKFTERGEVAVDLAHRDGALHVQVRDTGPGIAADQLDLLFRRFSQVDSSNTRRHGGSGLGLAICKGLAEAMGGDIGVQSTPGAGAVFRVRIPAVVAAAQDGLDAAA